MTNTAGALPGFVGVALTGFLYDATNSWDVSSLSQSLTQQQDKASVFRRLASSWRDGKKQKPRFYDYLGPALPMECRTKDCSWWTSSLPMCRLHFSCRQFLFSAWEQLFGLYGLKTLPSISTTKSLMIRHSRTHNVTVEYLRDSGAVKQQKKGKRTTSEISPY